MASLPTLPSLGPRFTSVVALAPQPTASIDRKLRVARQLRDADQARRTTSIAPPVRTR
jgi:hypothetical protein